MELGDGESRSDMSAFVERCGAAVHGCNHAEELGELSTLLDWHTAANM